MSLKHPFLADDFQIRWSTLTAEHVAPDVALAIEQAQSVIDEIKACLLYTSPSPRDRG